MTEDAAGGPTRRQLLNMIGLAGGSTAMYLAMYDLGYASPTNWKGPPKLAKAKPGASVLILGAGVAGMVAAMELRDAGYKVQVLEYQDRPGGRNMSLWGGDTVHELGGAVQKVEFDPGHYLNPGPWRIPYHHQGIHHYAARCGVEMEPFQQVNYNAYIHSTKSYGGKPRRMREVKADYEGHVAELLAKSAQQGALDQAVTKEDREILLQSLRQWGLLDKNYAYVKSLQTSSHRGYELNPGGGLTGEPTPSEPEALTDLLQGGLWRDIGQMSTHLHQASIFQPKGGMGMIGKAMGREVGPLIRYDSKVIDIKQDAQGVTVQYVDTKKGGAPMTATADWCICTIPLPVLGQIPMQCGPKLKAAIDHMAYHPSMKVGLQFKRRFWEQDEQIYGGITYTDQPNVSIGYPNFGYFGSGKGVLLGAYVSTPESYRYTTLTPQERLKETLYWVSKIHPQAMQEYETGVAVVWHHMPWILGCASSWTEQTRAAHYKNLADIDGRIVLAGEHVSYLSAWQEGAVTSVTDAMNRLQQKIMGTV
jgi:monoamine oxidase